MVRERPAWSLLPGMPDYQELGSALALEDMPTRLARATALLTEAGYNSAHPLKLTLTYNTSENHKKLALAVAAMWKPLGVEITLNNMEWNAYQVAKDSGDFMLARSFLFGDYVEPSSMLGSFRCQDPRTRVATAIRPSTACCNRPQTRWMAAHEPDSTARPSNC